jgi:hypothetical protein
MSTSAAWIVLNNISANPKSVSPHPKLKWTTEYSSRVGEKSSGITRLLDVEEVGLEKTFWCLETFLPDLDDSAVWEGIILDKDSRFFGEFIVEFEVIRDVA